MRLHDIADARIEIAEPADLPTEDFSAKQRFPIAWMIAGGTVLILTGILIGSLVKRSTNIELSTLQVRSVIKLGPGYSLGGSYRINSLKRPTRTAMAISRDGNFLVYSALKDDGEPNRIPQLFIRQLDELEATPIAGTEGGGSPFLSPDDKWVGFWAENKLWKVQVGGGIPQELCEVSRPFGVSWGDDGMIVFSSDWDKGLSSISAGSGETEPLTIPDRNREEVSHRLPHVLPLGKGILFTIMYPKNEPYPDIGFLDPETHQWRILLKDGSDARYIQTGHIIFIRQGTLMVVPFDINKPENIGRAVPIVSGVMQALNFGNLFSDIGSGLFSISNSGELVYVAGGIIPDKKNSLVWVDQMGTEQPIGSLEGHFFAPRLSPDGQKIAYTTLGLEPRLWVYDLTRDIPTMLTSEGVASYVNWVPPDGKQLAFSWIQSVASDLYLIQADGEKMELLYKNDTEKYSGSWSPEGDLLTFVEIQGDSNTAFLFDILNKSAKPFSPSNFNLKYP